MIRPQPFARDHIADRKRNTAGYDTKTYGHARESSNKISEYQKLPGSPPARAICKKLSLRSIFETTGAVEGNLRH